MKLSYTFSTNEFDALNRARRHNYRFNRFRQALYFFTIALNFLLSAWFLWTAHSRQMPFEWHYLANAALALGLLGLTYLYAPWARRRFFRKLRLEGEKIEIEFLQDGISIKSSKSESHYLWDGIFRVDEEPGHMIFWSSEVLGIVLPKSAASAEQLREIREMVISKNLDRNLINE